MNKHNWTQEQEMSELDAQWGNDSYEFDDGEALFTTGSKHKSKRSKNIDQKTQRKIAARKARKDNQWDDFDY